MIFWTKLFWIRSQKAPKITTPRAGAGAWNLSTGSTPYLSKQSSGHERTAISSFHDARTVKLALVQQRHIGKQTVIATIK